MKQYIVMSGKYYIFSVTTTCTPHLKEVLLVFVFQGLITFLTFHWMSHVENLPYW
jgi:hypothetical protein